MTTRALAPGILALLLFAGAQEPQEKPPESQDRRLALSKKNAAAEELESLVLSLGLDPHRGDPSAEHPSREDREAFERTPIRSWLEAQLRISDDSIAQAPATVRIFLEKRQTTLGRVVGVLDRDVPHWDSEPHAEPSESSGVVLGFPLARILTAAALMEERAGHHNEANDLLEACWSLSRSYLGQPEILSQIAAERLGRLVAGALRKMSEPQVQWLDRMSGVESWNDILDAVDPATRATRRSRDTDSSEADRVYVRAIHNATDRLRKMSPCEVSKLSYEEIWKPAQEELDRWHDARGDGDPENRPYIGMPNMTLAIQLTGRLLVDRELTAKILEIRQEKTVSREGRWPQKFLDLESRVCPAALYEYQTRAGAMMVRFSSPLKDQDGPSLQLPLSFEVRAPRPTPTATRARPAVTPRPRA